MSFDLCFHWFLHDLPKQDRISFILKLEDIGRGLQPLALAEAKKELNILFWLIFGNFWCPVVTLVTLVVTLVTLKKILEKKSPP